MIHKMAVGLAAIVLVFAPAAAQTYCGGDAPVMRMLTYKTGSVLVQTAWRGDFVMICNLNQT